MAERGPLAPPLALPACLQPAPALPSPGRPPCLLRLSRPAPPAPAPAVLVGCKIQGSVLGQSSYVGRGTRIESSFLLGNGAWMSDSQRTEALERGERVYGVGERVGRPGRAQVAARRPLPLMLPAATAPGRRLPTLLAPVPRTGENCYLRRCVVDENATIGNNVQVGGVQGGVRWAGGPVGAAPKPGCLQRGNKCSANGAARRAAPNPTPPVPPYPARSSTRAAWRRRTARRTAGS